MFGAEFFDFDKLKMAEWIRGKEYYVNFSNGGMEGLLEGLLMLGEKLPESESLNHTLANIRRLLAYPYGCRSFGIDESPDKNFTDEDFVEFARLINLFCIELTKEKSELEATRLYWFKEAGLNFLARLMNVYGLLESNLRTKKISIPKQEISLPSDEKITVERQRLFAHYNGTKHLLNNAEKFELWGKIVELYEQDETVTDLNALSAAYYQYAELLDDSVSKEKELSIWKRLLEIEKQIGDDEEGIVLIGEIIEGIEEE